MTADANDERALREQLDELKYKYRLMESLVSMISHEVRPPLGALRGFTEILLKSTTGDLNERQKRYLAGLKISTENIESVFSQFFDGYHALNGHLFLNFEETTIEELLPPIKPDNLTLEIPAELPKIWVDRHHLTQAFTALFSEAVPGWGENKATLQISYDEARMNFKIVSTANRVYFDEKEYPNPMLFYAQAVIEKHGGDYRIATADEGQEITVSLPIAGNRVSV